MVWSPASMSALSTQVAVEVPPLAPGVTGTAQIWVVTPR